jgi:hypothetical protein
MHTHTQSQPHTHTSTHTHTQAHTHTHTPRAREHTHTHTHTHTPVLLEAAPVAAPGAYTRANEDVNSLHHMLTYRDSYETTELQYTFYSKRTHSIAREHIL